MVELLALKVEPFSLKLSKYSKSFEIIISSNNSSSSILFAIIVTNYSRNNNTMFAKVLAKTDF